MTDRPTEDQAVALMEAARFHWSSRDQRFTSVRQMICETLFAMDGSPDAESLLREVRIKDRLISLSTVYRTLASLEEAGLIECLVGKEDRKQYSLRSPGDLSSSHIICTDCGRILRIENPCLPLRESAAAQEHGFNPEKFNLRLEASCKALHETGHCSHCQTTPGSTS